MAIGNRIKIFRNYLKKTQTEFGEMLGTGRNTIANYENGRVDPTDTFIQLLVTKYNVSEKWLRIGKGEMLQENENALFNKFSKQYNLTPAEQRVARYLLQLTSEDRQQLIKHIIGLAKAVDEPSTTTVGAVPSPEDEREALHRELDAALDAEKKAASASSATFSVIKNQ